MVLSFRQAVACRNGDQLSRSRRAGIRLRIALAWASAVLMGSPLVGKAGPGRLGTLSEPITPEKRVPPHHPAGVENSDVARHDVDARTMTTALVAIRVAWIR